MITLYDYLPSQNGWKVRQLLHHLEIPYRTEIVSIFEGEGQRARFRAINPWGAVPAIRLDDGHVLSESNAILWYLSGGTRYRDAEPFAEAKLFQWLSFETDYVQPTVGSLRYWTLTGKLGARSPELIESKRTAGIRALSILDDQLADRDFIAGPTYSIADISIFAYAHLAGDTDISTAGLRNFKRWVERIRSQERFLAEMFPYSIDPHASAELP